MRRIGRATGSTRSARSRSRTAIRLAVAVALLAGTGATVVPATSAAAAPSWSIAPSPSPPGPPIGELGGVSCASATDCLAVGANEIGPMAEHWNGTGWKIVGVPSPSGGAIADLDAVSCPSASECFAVGNAETDTATTFTDTSLIERWNGTAWSIVPSPNPTGANHNVQLSGVSCASTTSCFAVGNATDDGDFFFTAKTLVEQWNGTTWSIVASPNPAGALDSELNGVSCTSSTSCFAAGDEGGIFSAGALIEQWDGTSWTISPNPPPIGPSSAAPSATPSSAGSSGAAARALGAQAATLQAGSPAAITRAAFAPRGSASARRAQSSGARADGSSFGTIPGLDAVSCTSPTSCFAVGVSPNGALTEQWNGTAWAIVATPPLLNTDGGELLGISCPTSTDCTAVGDYSVPVAGDPFGLTLPLVERWNGTSWSVEFRGHGSVFSELDSVSCTDADNCAAVGDSAFVQHWNGTVWALAAFTSKTSQSTLVGVACIDATRCFAVGRATTDSGARTLVEELDGTTWSVVPSPNPAGSEATLAGVDCPSPTSCFAVGAALNDTGEQPLVEHWNGTAWSIVTSPSPPGAVLSELTGISCPSTVSCSAVGPRFGTNAITPLTEYWNGVKWSIVPRETEAGAEISELIGVSCVAASDCYAVGESDRFTQTSATADPLIEHWDGHWWSTVPNPALSGDGGLSGVSCFATDNCNAVGIALTNDLSTRAVAEHWNGVTWKAVKVPAPPHADQSALSTLACHSAISCFAVGGYSTATAGRSLVEHWNGSGWTFVASASPAAPPGAVGLNGVSYPSPTTCIAVGSYLTPFGSFNLVERDG